MPGLSKNLTIFTIPKAFTDEFSLIQTNAVQSWRHLRPRCEIVLCGNDAGVEKQAEILDVQCLPSIARTPKGTPLLNSAFASVTTITDSAYLCYVNADIILLSDFMKAAETLRSIGRKFLMVGQRRNLLITEPISFDGNWEDRLRLAAHRNGGFCRGIDFFLFPRNLWTEVPAFAVGRLYWDNWFLYAARCRGAIIVDVTPVVTAVHQEHPALGNMWEDPEAFENLRLLGGARNMFTVGEATHVLTPFGLRMRCRSCYPLCVCNPQVGGPFD